VALWKVDARRTVQLIARRMNCGEADRRVAVKQRSETVTSCSGSAPQAEKNRQTKSRRCTKLPGFLLLQFLSSTPRTLRFDPAALLRPTEPHRTICKPNLWPHAAEGLKTVSPRARAAASYTAFEQWQHHRKQLGLR
jgi:hypothetical protein